MGKQVTRLPLCAAILAILVVLASSSIVVLVSDSPAHETKAYAANKFKYAGSWSGTLKGTWTEAYPQEESRWSSEIKLTFTVQDVGSGENSAPLAGKAKVLLQQPHYVHHDPNIPRVSMQISPTEYTVGITGSISLDPPLLTIYPDAEPPIAATLVFYPEEGEPNTWQGTWQTGVLWLFEKLTYAERPAPAGIGKVLALSTSYQSEAYAVSATGEVTTALYPTFGLFIVAKVEYGEVKVVREGEEHTIIIDNMQTVEYDEYSGEETRENYYTLQVGDTIITELDTRVEIVVPEEDARILVEESSYIRIQQQGRRGEIDWQFGFSRGKTWIAIDGARFNIYTPSAVLGTLGTRFSLEVSEDGTTTLTVIDGIVKFSDLDLGKTVEVGQHQTSTVRPDEMPSDPVSIDPGDIVRWWEKPLAVVEKAASTISITASPAQISKGESIKITGSISPAVSGQTVTLTYKKAGEVATTRAVSTNADGTFSDAYVPDAGGSWSVVASWEGNDKYRGATSESVSFEIIDKGCVIATSTYGSELSPEVQFLRGFRESTVYSTFAGTSFMIVFNSFYYSWSPVVASQILNNVQLQTAGKAVITPLLGILHVSIVANELFNFNAELGIVMAGLVASSLIGLVYFGPLATIALYSYGRRRKSLPRVGQLRVLFLPLIASVALISVAELAASPALMVVSTATLVIFTIALTAGTIALKATEHTK